MAYRLQPWGWIWVTKRAHWKKPLCGSWVGCFVAVFTNQERKEKTAPKILQWGGKSTLISNICLWVGEKSEEGIEASHTMPWEDDHPFLPSCMLLFLFACFCVKNDLAFNMNVLPFIFNINVLLLVILYFQIYAQTRR